MTPFFFLLLVSSLVSYLLYNVSQKGVDLTFTISFSLLLFVPSYAVPERQGHVAECYVTESVGEAQKQPIDVDVHKEWTLLKHGLSLSPCGCTLGTISPLPSVVIGHPRLYHFIHLSGSQSEALTSGPFSCGGIGSYVSTEIPL